MSLNRVMLREAKDLIHEVTISFIVVWAAHGNSERSEESRSFGLCPQDDRRRCLRMIAMTLWDERDNLLEKIFMQNPTR